MRLALSISLVVTLAAACSTDESAGKNTSQEYATGPLPTADSVQRESDLDLSTSSAVQSAEAERGRMP